jgi:hypothetical protein
VAGGGEVAVAVVVVVEAVVVVGAVVVGVGVVVVVVVVELGAGIDRLLVVVAGGSTGRVVLVLGGKLAAEMVVVGSEATGTLLAGVASAVATGTGEGRVVVTGEGPSPVGCATAALEVAVGVPIGSFAGSARATFGGQARPLGRGDRGVAELDVGRTFLGPGEPVVVTVARVAVDEGPLDGGAAATGKCSCTWCMVVATPTTPAMAASPPTTRPPALAIWPN